MTDYQGMRWLKCDLQVQTPEDARHWSDPTLRLGDPRRPRDASGRPDESPIQEQARRFLTRCHALQLDAIGITDHNFSRLCEPRDWFITHLVEQNRSVARACGHEPLILFPGFEVDIGYHVLCLFEPATRRSDLTGVSEVLSKLGLPPTERFSGDGPRPLRFNGRTRSLKELLEIVQREHRGIVIAAHADRENGILEDASHSEDYRLADLSCIELAQHPPCRRIADILDGKATQWARRRPAVVQSSDAKSLASDDTGRPAANALGYRYTWIKMSRPSIEALRQAFLDHESRIRLPDDQTGDLDPGRQVLQERILSLRVQGQGFMDDQSVVFSPNLNCIIGGRGSGKSTLLEFMRLCMGKETGPDLRTDDQTRAKIERIKRTAPDYTEVRVRWLSRDGVEDVLVLDPSGGPARVEGRDLVDPSTFFAGLPVRFFSQQQLSQFTAKGTNHLLTLIDEFVRYALAGRASEERETRRELTRLFGLRRERRSLVATLRAVEQELLELTRQWSARAGLQAAANAHQALKAEADYVQRIREDRQEPATWLSLARDFAEAHSPPGSAAEQWPHGEWLCALDQRVDDAKARLLAAIEQAVTAFARTLSEAFTADPQWPGIEAALNGAEQAFLDACQTQGLTPAEVDRVQEIDRQRVAKQAQQALLQSQIQALDTQIEAIDPQLAKLHDIWRSQWRLRLDAARLAGDSGLQGPGRFIDIAVDYFGETSGFQAIWARLRPKDGRNRLARNWDDIGAALLRHRTETDADSVWEPLVAMLEDRALPAADLADWVPELRLHLQSSDQEAIWDEVRLSRVPDLVDLTLYRPDGTRAGSVAQDDLSDGQRNTAVLALLLGQDGGPLVIDQPEDELDSSFIYRDLVPMLRRIKTYRQLIFATHNANLPVNADAELVYAIEANAGRGRLLAQGGLDRDEVTRAVLDIMEGSREAFIRRREKYRF